MNDLTSAGHVRPMKSVATSMGGRGAANEVLRDRLAGNLLDEYHIVKEIEALEEAWLRMHTNGAVAYGVEHIIRAFEEGAIETLLISADVLRDETAFIDGTSWSQWIQQLGSIQADVIQCSSDHDAGQQLIGIGGAVALLRYRM